MSYLNEFHKSTNELITRKSYILDRPSWSYSW